jgi:hypothetical protein
MLAAAAALSPVRSLFSAAAADSARSLLFYYHYPSQA